MMKSPADISFAKSLLDDLGPDLGPNEIVEWAYAFGRHPSGVLTAYGLYRNLRVRSGVDG